MRLIVVVHGIVIRYTIGRNWLLGGRIRVHVVIVVEAVLASYGLILITDATFRCAVQKILDDGALGRIRVLLHVRMLIAVLVQVRFRRCHDQQAALAIVCERDVCQSRQQVYSVR